MKILFVCVVLPHENALTAGGREIYSYIKGLARRHVVDLVSAYVPDEEECFMEMEKICRKVFRAPRSRSLSAKTRQILSWLGAGCCGPLRHRPVVLLANQLIRDNDYDIAQVEFMEAGRHICRSGNAKLVLDNVDVYLKPALRLFQRERNIFKKIFLFLKWRYTRSFESKTYKKYDLVLCRSEYDRKLVDQYYPGTNTGILTHIVDFEAINSSGKVPEENHSLLFTGAFQRDLNVEAAEYIKCEIFPRVKTLFPDAILVFAGSHPPQKMRDWELKDSSIRVTGFVKIFLNITPVPLCSSPQCLWEAE